MGDIFIEIDGKAVPVAVVWVHLQGTNSNGSDCTIVVPAAFLKDVFDPTGEYGPEVRVDDQIRKEISEYGTFIIDGYLNNIDAWFARRSPFEWVISAISDVCNTGDAIVIRGKAVPFMRPYFVGVNQG